MLRNNLNNGDFTSIKEIEELSSVKIARCNELIHDLQKEFFKYKKLLELAEADRLETISHEVYYNDFYYYFENLCPTLNINSDELDIDAKKQLEYTIENIIGNKDVKVNKLMFEGFDNYNLSIYFTVADYPFTFELRVPNMKQIKKHFKDMNYGKMILFYEDKPNTWEFIYDSYDEKEFKDAFRKFINRE